MKPLNIAFGKRVRQIREEKGYSQRELAEMLGTAAHNLNFYEKGSRTAPIEMVVKMAEVLGTSCDFLLGGHDENGFFLDDDMAKAVESLKELEHRDRQVVMDLIQVLKKHT